MSQRGGLIAVAVLTLFAPASRGDDSPEGLAMSLRGLLVDALPNPLYEDHKHWDLQKPVPRGVKWRGKGLHVHPEVQYIPKNDGHWWQVRVTADHLADSLVFDLRDMQNPEPGRMTFTTFLAFDARIDYDRQVWDEGTRIYSAGVRARARLKMTLQCEVVTKLEPTGKLLPDAVFRFRVLKSETGYDNLVVEHIAGVGGEAAKLLGEAVHSGMKQWHPSLERRLLEKANAAIVKGGDTKEVRVGLTSLFGKK
jgi:hypothetical protein